MCARGYTTATYRPPSAETTKFKYGEAYPAYGIPASEPAELDHLVSLELGGANASTNLWPEPPPSPNEKDKTEGKLHAWVCAVSGAEAQGRLEAAQRAIAHNWVTAESVVGVPGAPPLPSAPAIDNSDDLQRQLASPLSRPRSHCPPAAAGRSRRPAPSPPGLACLRATWRR